MLPERPAFTATSAAVAIARWAALRTEEANLARVVLLCWAGPVRPTAFTQSPSFKTVELVPITAAEQPAHSQLQKEFCSVQWHQMPAARWIPAFSISAFTTERLLRLQTSVEACESRARFQYQDSTNLYFCISFGSSRLRATWPESRLKLSANMYFEK